MAVERRREPLFNAPWPVVVTVAACWAPLFELWPARLW